MKNYFASLALVLCIAVPASASVSHGRNAAIDALRPAGKHTFLVVARDGVIEVGVSGGSVQRKIARDNKTIRLYRLRAQKLNNPVLVLNEPVAHVARRLDTVRHLNDTAWMAMNLLVSLQLDRALAQGSYKYVVLSDHRSFVLLRQGSRLSRSGRGYTGIKIFMGKKTKDVNATIARLGYRQHEGVVLDVAELPRPSNRVMSSTALMLRVQNRKVGDSPVLDRLISVQQGA